jgi:RNA-directed DNA polymerase
MGLERRPRRKVDDVEDRPTETEPPIVTETAKQGGEACVRWAWVEPVVWTKRMLAALIEGVKGGRWFSLIDKVWMPANLRRAFWKVKANHGAAGVDSETVEMFERHLEANVEKLSKQLRNGGFCPHAVRRTWISKGPGSNQQRPLGIPVVRDRVVQGALRHVLEPIFEQGFCDHSYGFRPKRGAKDALRRVDQLLKADYHWVVDADLKSYFDTIPHEQLLERVKAKVADGRVLDLIGAYLKQQVMESAKSWTPEEGTPQGAVLSPLLANIYLDPLDHLMEQAGTEMIRYADDFVILCRSEAEARVALERVQQWVEQAGLTLHPEKTRVVDATQAGGFDFLGYHFERGERWPRKKSLMKLKETIRAQTRRNNGHSLTVIINRVSDVLRGWFEYFKHSRPWIFERLDRWIRMRLRSILRRRQHRRGRGRGSDHQRWPNAYFAKQGLLSLAAAHAIACRSSRR